MSGLEVLGVAASVIAVVTVTIQVASGVYTTLSSYASATEEGQRLLSKVSELQQILNIIESLAKSSNRSQALTPPEGFFKNIQTPLLECQNTLQDVYKKLASLGIHQKKGKVLQKINQIIKRDKLRKIENLINDQKQQLHTHLTISGMYVYADSRTTIQFNVHILYIF